MTRRVNGLTNYSKSYGAKHNRNQMHMIHTFQVDVRRLDNDATRAKIQVSKSRKQLSIGDKQARHQRLAQRLQGRSPRHDRQIPRGNQGLERQVHQNQRVLRRQPSPRTPYGHLRHKQEGSSNPNVRGPYIITKKTSSYTYRLTNQTSVQLDHGWCVDNLHKILSIKVTSVERALRCPCNLQNIEHLGPHSFPY